MEGRGTHGCHDENPWGKPETNKSAKFSRKLSEKFEKTKHAASAGMKKVKRGTKIGIYWLKLKYKLSKKNKN
ncbi:hypothetical protein LguiA_032708 [Lonicera macranthoides]